MKHPLRPDPSKPSTAPKVYVLNIIDSHPTFWRSRESKIYRIVAGRPETDVFETKNSTPFTRIHNDKTDNFSIVRVQQNVRFQRALCDIRRTGPRFGNVSRISMSSDRENYSHILPRNNHTNPIIPCGSYTIVTQINKIQWNCDKTPS